MAATYPVQPAKNDRGARIQPQAASADRRPTHARDRRGSIEFIHSQIIEQRDAGAACCWCRRSWMRSWRCRTGSPCCTKARSSIRCPLKTPAANNWFAHGGDQKLASPLNPDPFSPLHNMVQGRTGIKVCIAWRDGLKFTSPPAPSSTQRRGGERRDQSLSIAWRGDLGEATGGHLVVQRDTPGSVT